MRNANVALTTLAVTVAVAVATPSPASATGRYVEQIATGPSHGWAYLASRLENRIQLATRLPTVNYFGTKAFLDDRVFLHFVATFEPAGNAVLYVDGEQQATVGPSDPAAMADACPATAQGILSGSGSWSGGTTGLANNFEFDYPQPCSYSSGGGSGADEIFKFQVDSTGIWDFDTCTVPAGRDSSLGIRVDSGGGCPGDPVDCDGDGCNVGAYESEVSAFLSAGTDYYMVVDGWVAGSEGPYTVTYIQSLVACTSDAFCSDGEPCNGDETCNLGNGQCEAGTPPCDRSQSCDDDGFGNAICTDPDGCLIYQNYTQTAGWTSLGGGTEGTLVADDWGFEVGNLGRNLDSYSTMVAGTAGAFAVTLTLWAHGKNCVGGSNDPACGTNMGECDTDADCTGGFCVGGAVGIDCTLSDVGVACTTDVDCPGNCDLTTATLCLFDGDCPGGETCINQGTCPGAGTCEDLGFFGANQRPGRAEIPGTLCVFPSLPSGYFITLTCTPGSGSVMPADGVWQVMGFVQTGGSAGPVQAGKPPEIGSSTDIYAWDQGSAGTAWGRFWFGGGDLANWVGDLCTEPVGACCDPGLGGTCSITTQAACAGTYIGDNNAATEFDCSADADGDGVSDPCEVCSSWVTCPPLYVDVSAGGLPDGTSWTDAYTTLQDALADARSNGGSADEIWVAAGTYTPDQRSCASAADCDGPGGGTCPAGQCVWNSPREQTFQLLDSVAICGGFAGGETSLNQRNIEANETTLSGDLLGDDAPLACAQNSPDCDLLGARCIEGTCIIANNNGENSYHVVWGNGTDATAILDGFTISAGNADGTGLSDIGAGMYNVTGTPTVTNCTFTGNTASSGGGGMWNAGGGQVADCTFTRNAAGWGGGGMVSGPGTVTGCEFSGNSAADRGGGMYNEGSSLTVTNCTFSGNSANAGGALVNAIGSPTLSNCTFTGNTASAAGGGMFNENNSSPTITNCGFSSNSAGAFGGGVYNWDSGSNPALTNCVLWGNSDGGGTDESAQIDGAIAVVNYSIVQGGWTGAGGTGNSSSDPLFERDPDDGGDGWGVGDNDNYGDLHLRSDSPAIDAADTTALPADAADLDNDGDTGERLSLDLDGGLRVLDDLLTPDTGVAGSGVVDMGAYEFLRDCNGNGIPDDQDLAECAGDPACSDCNANNNLDECDIAECDIDVDLSCNDCNLNGVPDGCDDPGDNLPDSCVEPAGGNWSDDIWGLGGLHPNDIDNGSNVPDVNVTIDGVSVIVDIEVEIPTLRLINGASLEVTGGNLTVTGPGGIFVDGSSTFLRDTGSTLTVGDTNTLTCVNLLVRGDDSGTGSILVGTNSTVSVSGELAIEGGGEYRADAANSFAQLSAGTVALSGGLNSTTPGGYASFTGMMTADTTGDFVLDGTGADPNAPCSDSGVRVPSGTRPILPIRDNSVLYIAADFVLLGSVEISGGANATLSIGGDFRNHTISPNCIKLNDMEVVMHGDSAGLRATEQLFEVAGEDLDPELEGFHPPGSSHTNYSIGTVRIGQDAVVRFIDEFDNDGSGGADSEALYIHKLVQESDLDSSVDDCNVYNGDLVSDGGGTIEPANGGEIAEVNGHVARPQTAPYPHNRRKNRYISIDPDKEVSDGVNIAFKVELLSINQGSCDDGTGAQGGNVDFCRGDRGTADCKACSTSGDSCISASIDCPTGESCDPTGATCVSDLPNSGGSNIAMVWWIGPEKDTATDPNLNIHLLVSEPFRKVSTDWPNPVHAGDCEVVPQAVYGVRAVETAGSAESDELVVETTQFTPPPTGNAPFWWGDLVGVLAFHCNADIREQTCDPNTANGDCTGFGVPAACCTGVGTGLCDCSGGDPCLRAWELPNGVTNVDDVTAALWTSAPSPPTTVSADATWVDVHGNDSFTPGSQNFDPPNNKINASDLQQIGSAFGGLPYKFYDPADCPDLGDWP